MAVKFEASSTRTSSFICDNKGIKLIWESKLALDRFLKQLCDIPISYSVY